MKIHGLVRLTILIAIYHSRTIYFLRSTKITLYTKLTYAMLTHLRSNRTQTESFRYDLRYLDSFLTLLFRSIHSHRYKYESTEHKQKVSSSSIADAVSSSSDRMMVLIDITGQATFRNIYFLHQPFLC